MCNCSHKSDNSNAEWSVFLLADVNYCVSTNSRGATALDLFYMSWVTTIAALQNFTRHSMCI